MNTPANTFRPLATPRVVHDLSTGQPALLLGHWLNPLGYEISAAVATMVMARPLGDIKPYPAPASTPGALEHPV